MERRRAIDTDAFSAILKSESRSGDRGRTHYGEGAAYLCVVMLVGASTQLLHVGIVLLVVGGFAIILQMRAPSPGPPVNRSRMVSMLAPKSAVWPRFTNLYLRVSPHSECCFLGLGYWF
jgi:hypothetical protein